MARKSFTDKVMSIKIYDISNGWIIQLKVLIKGGEIDYRIIERYVSTYEEIPDAIQEFFDNHSEPAELDKPQ